MKSSYCLEMHFLYFMGIFLFSAITSGTFLSIGSRYTKTKPKENENTRQRRFKSFFGVTPHVCLLVWNKIQLDAPSGAEPKHLLWCLNFLKEYPVEHTRKALLNANEKTIRKWTWIFVKLVADINTVWSCVICILSVLFNEIHNFRSYGKIDICVLYMDKPVSCLWMVSIFG